MGRSDDNQARRADRRSRIERWQRAIPTTRRASNADRSDSGSTIETTGIETTGNEMTRSETTGSETTGSETTRIKTTGIETTGSETTGNETSRNANDRGNTTTDGRIGGFLDGKRVAVGASLAIHAVLGFLLIALPHGEAHHGPASARIELTDVEPASDVQLVDLSNVANDGGGGSPGALASPKASAKPTQVASRDSRSSSSRNRETAMPDRDAKSIRSLLGEVSIEARDQSDAVDGGGRCGNSDPSPVECGGDDGTGGGQGGGIGGGLGRGRGLGVGAGVGDGILTQQLPPAPKVSKARPPKLIYPVREHEVDDEGELYLARVTIDTDGYVVGSTLLRGPVGPRAQAGQVFRFRYLPALDDDGRPIKATIEQPFLVQ